MLYCWHCRKLEEVRERLDQLKSLVQYYRSGTQLIHGADDDDDGEQASPSGSAAAAVSAADPSMTSLSRTAGAGRSPLTDSERAESLFLENLRSVRMRSRHSLSRRFS